MPHFFEHGVEIRMYSWAVLFSSAAAVFALCWIRSVPRSGLWLIASTVCGAYTHQYALVAEGFIWLMLLFISVYKKTLKQWFIEIFLGRQTTQFSVVIGNLFIDGFDDIGGSDNTE